MTLGDVVAQLTPAFSPQRAQQWAVTEVTRAATQAVSNYQTQMQAVGVRMQKIAHGNRDEKQCIVCGGLDGKAESEWPSQYVAGPPFHVACRCWCTLARTPEATTFTSIVTAA